MSLGVACQCWGAKTIAQLKCIYTNARSMGGKQEELEAIVQRERYDLVAVTETWWGDSHDWSAKLQQLFFSHHS